jgi:23S rRNA pseudouridine2605 synthase
MLAKLDHKVMRLKRVAIGPVKLDKLPKGKARRVSEDELKSLRAFVARSQEKIAAARLKAAENSHKKAQDAQKKTEEKA